MANSQNFRSAFNGFNREDVVHYLEYLNSKHSTLINQLSEEAETLRQKLSLAAEAIACDSARAERITALEQELEELRQQRDEAVLAAETAETECASLRQQLADATAPLEEALEKCAQLEAQLQSQPARTAEVASPTLMKELEAYRRAERLERVAQERAGQIYRKTNGVLAEASVMVDQLAADIGGAADQVVQQLQMLQQTVSGSKQALQDAAAVMYAIRPEAEEI